MNSQRGARKKGNMSSDAVIIMLSKLFFPGLTSVKATSAAVS